MIKKRQAQKFPRSFHLLCQPDILTAGRRIPAGVIMDKRQPYGVVAQSFDKNFSGRSQKRG